MGSPGRPDEVDVVVDTATVVVEPSGVPVVVDETATVVTVLGVWIVDVLVPTTAPDPHATNNRGRVTANTDRTLRPKAPS
jgi:hypothetical protein